ncbi:MAG: hypothetical protein LBQ10_03820 [Desulfovibrio sp.]|jgi:hypothetical protein|nr:hypothetical protein [Desulfovibrio sp.]
MGGWGVTKQGTWLRQAVRNASLAFFGEKAVHYGEGGSIDFVKALSGVYPHAQIPATGVPGLNFNARSAGESLNLDMARRLTMCPAHVVAAHARRRV